HDGIHAPGAFDALQLVLPTVLERQPGPRDEVVRRRAHEHLAGIGDGHHSRADVHGYAAGLLSDRALDLPRVDARPHLEPQLAEHVPNRDTAADRPCRPVEQREEAVARRVDLLAAETHQLTPDRRMMSLEERAPGRVAELTGLDRRPDEVGEEDAREHTVARDPRRRPREELLHVTEELVRIVERHVVHACELDEARAGDMTRDVA